MIIELPSGAAGSARKFKTGDLQELADGMEDDRLATEGIFLLVRSSWLQCSDPGPYPEDVMAYGTGTPNWPRVLKGDLISALFQTRIGSFRDGHMYQFDVPCEHNEKCPPIEWEIDLRELVSQRVKRLPESSLEHVRTGEPLVTRLYNPETQKHDGPAVSFRLQTVSNEGPIVELRKKQLDQNRRQSNKPNLIDQLASQIIAVEGQKLTNERQVWQWVQKLDLEYSLDLQAAFEEADCGYDTAVEVRCKQCRRTQKVDLPLQKGFLVPSRRKRAPEDEAEQSSDL